MTPSPRPTARRLPGALLAAALLTGPALAQTWVPIDTAPPGTPAEVLFDEGDSTEQFSTIEVRIHGFWVEDELGADGTTYQRLSFPGLALTDRLGAPALPAARLALGVTTDTDTLRYEGSEVLGQLVYEDILPAPLLTDGEDEEFDPTWDPGPGDTTGSDPDWAFDADVYNGVAVFPDHDAKDAAVAPLSGPVPGGIVYAHPVSWDPLTRQLTVNAHVKYSWSSAGETLEPLLLTKLADKSLAQALANWSISSVVFPFDPFEYHSRLLIVAQPLWFDTLAPFVFQKKALGYDTTLVATLPDVDSIRNAIMAWYFEGDPGDDHYVLLCGDANLVPLGLVTPSGANVWSDDVYASVGPIDFIKEVHVGRLSVDGEADLATQLSKIMEYELDPAAGDYDRALLVAHDEDAPGKYQGSHQAVLNYPYLNPPAFVSAFGSALATTNSSIASVIEDGVAVVGYRGHGSTRAWTGWNFWDDNWHVNDVMALANEILPVVWNIACTNHNIAWEAGISDDDSLGEVFMETPRGAVASYGATRTTSTTQNHFLNERLFEYLYGFGITNHAQLTELAELVLHIVWPDHKNPWAYNLLGDPTMTIRRGVIEPPTFALPGLLSLDLLPDSLPIAAIGSQGSDLVDGLVSLYKPSFLQGAPDELLGAWWLDSGGQAEVPLKPGPLTPGPLYVTVRDAHGNLTQQVIDITMGAAWDDVGDALEGELGAPRLAGTGSLAGGTPWSLLLTNARPLSTAWLCLGVAKLQAPFKGGVLVPDLSPPGFALPLPTDTNGDIPLASAWPTGIPAGVDFVFQYWVQDASGPFGFTASNGLVGTTP